MIVGLSKVFRKGGEKMKLWWNKKIELREDQKEEYDLAKQMFIQGGGMEDAPVGRIEAMKIPSFSSGVDLITDTFASLEVKLYKEEGDKVEEVKDDPRISFLNDDTGDVLSGFEMKKSMCEDYLLEGNGYIYINKSGNNVKSLHYISAKDVSIREGNDPIFKDSSIVVNQQEYKHFNFVILNRKTKNGTSGTGIIEESNLILSTMYNSLDFENAQVKNGGLKKGVIKSVKKLAQDALDKLKESWTRLYGKNSRETCIILNDGLDYKELQQTSVEMQLLENKRLNGAEGLKLLKIPPSLFENPSADVKGQFYKAAINPIITNFEAALNKTLLLEKEKGVYYFKVDTKDLNKGDMESRFRAYEVGLKNGFILTNEVRYLEDLPEIDDFNYLRMSLGEVLYDTKTKTIFTPNTGQVQSGDGEQADPIQETEESKTDDLKGGDENESGDQE